MVDWIGNGLEDGQGTVDIAMDGSNFRNGIEGCGSLPWIGNALSDV